MKGSTDQDLIRCIEDCYDCAQTCTSCADACLAEPQVNDLRQCIGVNLDCARVCEATGAVASRRTGSDEALLAKLLEACMTACRLCAEECRRHASEHEHCRICAEACEQCENSCRTALSGISSATH